MEEKKPIFCPQCGNKLDPNFKFCNVCGAPIRQRKVTSASTEGAGAASTESRISLRPDFTSQRTTLQRTPIHREETRPIDALLRGRTIHAALSQSALGAVCWACTSPIPEEQTAPLCQTCGTNILLPLSPTFPALINPKLTNTDRKICPECTVQVPTYVQSCPNCGYQFAIPLSSDIKPRAPKREKTDLFAFAGSGIPIDLSSQAMFSVDEFFTFIGTLLLSVGLLFVRNLFLSNIDLVGYSFQFEMLAALAFVSIFGTAMLIGKLAGHIAGLNVSFQFNRQMFSLSLIMGLFGVLFPPASLLFTQKRHNLSSQSIAKTGSTMIMSLILISVVGLGLQSSQGSSQFLILLSQSSALFAIYLLLPLNYAIGNRIIAWSKWLWGVLFVLALTVMLFSISVLSF